MKTTASKLFYIGSWVINLILPLLVFGVFTENFLNTYYNSDTLYLASIYKDIFEDGTGFTGWNLNGAPNFFPDMFLYFIVRAFTGDFRVAYMAFSIIQYIIIVWLLGNLFKGINPKIDRNYITLFNLLFPVYLLATILHGSFQYTFDVFSQSYHNGCFINTLVALNFFFRYLTRSKKSYLIPMLISVFIGAFNDRLFMVTFSVPVLAVLVYNLIWVKNKIATRTSLLAFGTSIMGLLVFNATKTNSVYRCIGLGEKFMNFSNAGPSFKNLVAQHTDFIQRTDLRGFITVLTSVSFITLLVILIKNLFQSKRDVQTDFSFSIEYLFMVFSVSSVFLTLFAPVINGYYLGPACIRYTTFSFFLSLFNVVFIAYYFFKHSEKKWKEITISTLTILYFSVITITGATKPIAENLKMVANYYPEKVKAVDEFAKKHHLQYGVAGYWDAKYTTMFSKENLRVYTVINSELKVWFHVMNSNWYFDYEKGKYNHPVFNFVIIDQIKPEELKKNFGNPKDSLYFQKEPLIYVIDSFKYDRKTRSPYLIHQ